jgi:hypothetical protein
MDNLIKYLEYIKINDAEAGADFVDTLSHEERKELVKRLEATGCRKLLRNLFYDYKKQEWI